jgi:hypothetical protein
MGPDHFSPVARAPQGVAQVRIVEHVPEPIYRVPISPRLIGNHPLDRSQGKRAKCVAAAFQRRPYGLRTDEFAEAHHQRGVTQGMHRGQILAKKPLRYLNGLDDYAVGTHREKTLRPQ